MTEKRKEQLPYNLFCGAAKADITPPLGTQLYGYAPGRPAQSVGDALEAVAVKLVSKEGSALMMVSQIPIRNAPITAPGIEPMPPNTAATKDFSPGIEPAIGVMAGYVVKYRMEPTTASAEPMTKVAEMTLLTLMPIRRAVSKSLETARMAIPILVWLIS